MNKIKKGIAGILVYLLVCQSIFATTIAFQNSSTPFRVVMSGDKLKFFGVPADTKYKYWVVMLVSTKGTYRYRDSIEPENGEAIIDLPAEIPKGKYYINLYYNSTQDGDFKSYSYNTLVATKNKTWSLPADTGAITGTYQDKDLKATERIEATDYDVVRISNRVCANAYTSYSKVLCIYKWIRTNISYDASDIENVYNYSAKRTLYKKTGVCSGIACLYTAMCRAQGIPCRIVQGTSLESGKKITHAWCETYVDGRWILVDPTWDNYFDPDPSYFNLTHIKLQYYY